MSKSTKGTDRQQREARWRDLIARQAASGRSVAAFCRDESVPVQTFYWRRARLGKPEAKAHRAAGSGLARFIDLGAVAGRSPAGGVRDTDSGIEVRIDLPAGISVSIVRR
jgi:hypothetical protein